MFHTIHLILLAGSMVHMLQITECRHLYPRDPQTNSSRPSTTSEYNQSSSFDAIDEEQHSICYEGPLSEYGVLQCTERGTLLLYNYCMTVGEEYDVISIGLCPYFEFNGHNVSEPGLIDIPNNISQLNEYMCSPMNRKGLVCSECIDGYGPSVMSPKFRCSDCRNAWYGIPVYLALEIVPVTVFYFIVLLFQLNLTSAPMTSFVLYSNFILIWINFYTVDLNAYSKTVALLYGVWSLDFFRYAVPPFCVSSKLKITHVLYLQGVSAILPYLYIAITWILIKLHARGNRIVVWLWKMMENVIRKRIKIKRDAGGYNIINAIATFFLLSFAKVTFILVLALFPLQIHQMNSFNGSESITTHPFTDPGANYASGAHLPFMVLSIAVFLFIVLPPILIIALYPLKVFRKLLSKCCGRQFILTLNFFVEKFHSSYRDGLDGGRDMRSFASLYFFVVLLAYAVWSLKAIFFSLTILFGGCSLLVALVQPYKNRYMSVIDSLILANVAFFTAVYDRNIYAFSSYQILSNISVVLPAIGLILYICFKLVSKPCSNLYRISKEKISSLGVPLCCRQKDRDRQGENVPRPDGHNATDLELQLPDRVIHPESYEQHEVNYTAY